MFTRKAKTMKIYTGKRTANGTRVVVRAATPVDQVARYELPHIERHSPDGFEWGFEGSGPMDLAYAILSDFVSPSLADAAYRPFAHQVIASLPNREWTITAEQIIDFLVDAAIGKGV